MILVYKRDASTYGSVYLTTTANIGALCPDLLRYEQIAEADRWRGRVVRAFFWLLRVWPV